MTRNTVFLAALAAAILCTSSTPARAVPIETEIAPAHVTASSTFSREHTAKNLINGSGLDGDLHDNHRNGATMWHTVIAPVASRPAPGLPESRAWVRFDFAAPPAIDVVRIWNHNQAHLTDRGFRKTRIVGSDDGKTWTPLTQPEVVELPRANGERCTAVDVPVAAKGKPIRSVIIAAELKDGHYGGNVFGLSEVRFVRHTEVAEADIPAPTDIECIAQPFYVRRTDGATGRPIDVQFRGPRLYGPATVEVRCDGAIAKTEVAATPRGTAKIAAMLPDGKGTEQACEAEVVVRAAKREFRKTVAVPRQRKYTVYILMHSHNDIGYTAVQTEIAKKQAHNVARALELIEATKDYPADARFKWNLEVYWPAQQFLATATAEQKAAFAQAVRGGSIGIDAMHTNLLTGACRGEELLRAFGPAAELGRECGVAVRSMMISDVPGLTWGIVPALAQNGVRYISDGPNYIDRIGYARITWENKPFYWLSPSGRERVLYWAPYFGYAYGHTVDLLPTAVERYLKRLDESGYPYDVVQMRWSKGDNGSADERVMDQVRDWNARYAWPRLVIATTAEAFADLEKRYGDKLPEFRGDFTPYWEDGLGSAARETGLGRMASDRLAQAETLWAMLAGASRYPRADFVAAWNNVFLWSEHTWGAHCSISQPDSDFTKAQWRIKQAFAWDADRQSKKLLGDALALRGPAAGSGPKDGIDVFNTASWPRTDLVTVPKELSQAGDVVQDAAGKPLPSQRLASGELVFLAADVPPLGGRRYTIAAGTPASPQAAAQAAADGLRTPSLRVQLDPKSGAIANLQAAGIDANLVDPQGGGLNQYVYLLGGNVKQAVHNGPATLRMKETGPLLASIVAESDAPGCRKLTREVRVIAGLDRVEIINTVDKLPIRAKEGVHFGFGFNVPGGEVRVNSAWAVVRAEKDQLPGACKNWYSVERWADVSNDRYGVTWATVEAPLMEIGGLTADLPATQPNPKAYLDKIAPSATLYSWAMNNHWHTNYRADQEGPTTFRYAIQPHSVRFDPLIAARFGIEATESLVVAAAAGPAPSGSRLTIDAPGVIINSVKPSNDGRAIIVRLFGAGGKDEQARLVWSDPPPRAVSVSDAAEQPGTPVTGPIAVPAWGVVTVRAEMR